MDHDEWRAAVHAMTETERAATETDVQHSRAIATATKPAIPAENGLYPGIPDTVYHADRGSLSSSGARKLLPPSCPAIFRHEMRRPPKPLPQFDFGHLAHKFVLGAGGDVEVIHADDWRTKAAKEQRDQAHAEGRIPVLNADYVTAMAMKQAAFEHPLAAALLTDGTPELSGFWHDPDTGVRLRFRTDWLTKLRNGRTVIVDYKTSTSAHPGHFAKAAADFGYHIQQPFYLTGLSALQIADDAAFLFIVQSKTPPYLVSVIELDPQAVELGARLARRAIDIYAKCTAADEWPDYGTGIHPVSLPSFAIHQQERALEQ